MPESKGEADTGVAGTDTLKESYLLCTHCDGQWVDAKPRTCDCGLTASSKDFILCLACALRRRRCQHCGKKVNVRIDCC